MVELFVVFILDDMDCVGIVVDYCNMCKFLFWKVLGYRFVVVILMCYLEGVL